MLGTGLREFAQARAFWAQRVSTGGRTKVKEDRRALPRVEADLSVQMVLADSEEVSARLRDISRAGVSIACDRKGAERIMPQEKREARTAAICTVRLSLEQLDGPPQDVAMRCVLVHASHRTGGDYFLGFRFLDVDGDGYDAVERFIAESLRWD